MLSNDELIKLAVDVASSSGSENLSLNKNSGEKVSEFIEEIYNKLCALNEKSTNQ